jgi:NAD(P)-dependent dehydrogenase (short-subunit alcohol dehydrogenase family)
MAVVLVIGASRGIGRGLVRACLERGDRVIATVRQREDMPALRGEGAEVLQVDVANPASVSGLAWQLNGVELDQAWYVAGAWDGSTAATPPTQPDFDRVMHTNVLGAMQVLPQVMPCVVAAGGTMVCISSMMSRLGDAQSSAWLYRTSKAALNMVVACTQTEWPGAQVIAMDPGWVQTDMGGEGAQISVETCVQGMLHTVGHLTPQDAGRLLRYDGRRWENG